MYSRVLLNQRLRFPSDAAKTSGYGIVRGSEALRDMQKVIVVLEKTTRNGKLYFVLTAFPVP